MQKIVHFGEFLKICSLRSNSVTRQVSFNRTKIDGKCQNSKIQMRHFGWFSNNVRRNFCPKMRFWCMFAKFCFKWNKKVNFVSVFKNVVISIQANFSNFSTIALSSITSFKHSMFSSFKSLAYKLLIFMLILPSCFISIMFWIVNELRCCCNLIRLLSLFNAKIEFAWPWNNVFKKMLRNGA